MSLFLFLKAEQAVKQLTDADEDDTIDWMAPPATPPSSPTEGTIPKKVYDLSLSTPTCFFFPRKGKEAAQTSSPPDSQAHTPSSSTSRCQSRRQKNRKRARSGMVNPPAKKQKLTHESDITDKKGKEVGECGAIEHNGGSENDLADAAEVETEAEDQEGEEESPDRTMLVTLGAS